MEIQLAQGHDLPELSKKYSEKNRLQVRDILTDDSAREIHALLSRLPWGLIFNQGQKVHELSKEKANSLNPQQVRAMSQMVREGAAHGYQFLYNYYPMFARYFDPSVAREPLFDIYEFLNGKPFLDFMRTLTGLQNIRWADAHATLYRGGHFLKFHTDEHPDQNRLVAYVLNFSKDWNPDWGGLLQFWDEKKDIEQAYRPIFNGLNLFTIPADHSVSIVPPYSPGMRYSITGWLRGDEPPGPIPKA